MAVATESWAVDLIDRVRFGSVPICFTVSFPFCVAYHYYISFVQGPTLFSVDPILKIAQLTTVPTWHVRVCKQTTP